MISYEQFKQWLHDNLQDHYTDYEIIFRKSTRVNRSCTDAVTIFPKEGNIKLSATLYLDILYSKFIEDKGNLWSYIDISLIQSKINTPLFEKEYENFKITPSSLILSVCNTNISNLDEIPHYDFYDMSVIVRCLSKETPSFRETVIIDNETLEKLNMTKEEIFKLASKNMEFISFSLEKLIDVIERDSPEFISENLRNEASDLLYILRTTNSYDSLTILFNEKILSAVYDRLGAFYLLPSSLYELMVISKDYINGSAGVSELKNMLVSINDYLVSENDLASNNVFEYSPQTGLILAE